MRAIVLLSIVLASFLTFFVVMFPPTRYTITINGSPNDSYITSYGAYGIGAFENTRPFTFGGTTPYRFSFWSNQPHILAILASGSPATLTIERWGSVCAKINSKGGLRFGEYARCDSGWSWLFSGFNQPISQVEPNKSLE